MSRIFLCAGRHIGLPLAVVLSMCPPAPAGAAGLNDTGLLDCYSASGLVSCADVNALPRQDSFHGRDAAYATGLLVKIGGGAAGFDFTKVCANGDVEGSGSCPLNPAANSGANPGPTEWAYRKFKRPFRAVCWVGGGRASPVLGTDRTSVSGISASRGHAAALSAAMLR